MIQCDVIVLFCLWCSQPIPEDRRRRGCTTCSRECGKEKRKHYLAERKLRYRKAAGLGDGKCERFERAALPASTTAQDVAGL
jgi:predicted nucleic acid-binding Zn ribbon protein